MMETSWDAVYDVSFKSVPISEPLKNAVQVLRDTTQLKLVGLTTTATFLADAVPAHGQWSVSRGFVHGPKSRTCGLSTGIKAPKCSSVL